MVLPIMFGMFSTSVVLFIDAAFVSRLGTVAFDAMGNASLFYITLYMTAMGISEGGQILIARRYGESKPHSIGLIWQHTLITLVAWIMILMLISAFVLPAVFLATVSNKDIGESMISFLSIRQFGYIFATLQLGANCLLIGTGRTKVLYVSTAIVAGVNIVLDYALIFGHFGIPEMGMEGAALASVIAEACGGIFLIAHVFSNKTLQNFGIRIRNSIEFNIFRSLFKVSMPLMIQGFLSVGGWTFFFMMIEQMGPHELEVSQVIHKLYFLALIPIIGFNAATKTFVSNQMALHDPAKVVQVVKRILLMNLIVLLFFVHGNLLYPEFLIGMVSSNSGLLEDAVPVLILITGSIFVHGLSGVLLNTISGTGQTRVSMYIEGITILVYMGFIWMGVKSWGLSLEGIWAAEYVYFICIGLLSAGWLRKGTWRKQMV